MSVHEETNAELSRIEEAKAAIIAAIAAKGVVVVDGAKLDALAEKIAEISQGVELPELTNPGTAADLAEGMELLDQNGEKVTGTLAVKDTIGIGALYSSVSEVSATIQIEGTYTGPAIVKDANIWVCANKSEFGDATEADVVAGKTFTSAAGLKKTGTHVCETGGSGLPDGAVAVQMVTGDETSTQVASGYSISITYGDALVIDDSIAIAFSGTTSTLSGISDTTDFSVLEGKYISSGSTYGSSSAYYYVPVGAAFTVGGSTYSKTLTCDKAQAVSLQKVSL